MWFAAQPTDEQRDMNKAVGPAPEPFSGAGGAGAVPPCSYLTAQPRYCPTEETGDNLRKPACDTDNGDLIPLTPIRRRAKLHPDLVATLGIHYFGRPEAAEVQKPSTQKLPAICPSNSFLDHYEPVGDRIIRIAGFENRTGFSARHLNLILGNVAHHYKLDKHLTFHNFKTRVKL